MADSRLYIVNRDTGFAARFYARSGIHYSVPEGILESLQALCASVSDETAISDDFFITANESEVERATGAGGWRWTAKPPEPDKPDPRDAELLQWRKIVDELRNQNFTLVKKLEHIQKLSSGLPSNP
jgi:hypothetical protein